MDNLSDETWAFIHARAKTPCRERFYVGDWVRILSGHYGHCCNNLALWNPIGCVRKVVHVYTDDHGNRRVWVQLKMPWAKRNPTEGWVSPAWDELTLHKRPMENSVMYLLESALNN